MLGVGCPMRKAHDRLIEWLKFGGYSQSEAETIANYLVFHAGIGDAETEDETFYAWTEGFRETALNGQIPLILANPWEFFSEMHRRPKTLNEKPLMKYIAYTSLDGDQFWIPSQEFGRDFYDFESAEPYGAVRSNPNTEAV